MSIFHGDHGLFGQPKVKGLKDVWWKTAPKKYLVPWISKSPLISVLNNGTCWAIFSLHAYFQFLFYFLSNMQKCFFSNFSCSISLSLRNLQEQVKKVLCYQELFWPFTAWINCSSDFFKFSAFSLEFQKFFSITRTFFSHIRSELFW